ncbi:MAG: hypothetical protein ABIC40_05935 [bacterium]
MQLYLLRTGLVVMVTLAVFGIFWAAGKDFGMRQAIEFLPYSSDFKLDNGTSARSGGVTVEVNEYGAAPDERAVAVLMLEAYKLYPKECSADNWEIAVRRKMQNGGDEKFSFYSYTYETGGPGSRIEYGYWTDEGYVVGYSYSAGLERIKDIAGGKVKGFEEEGG